MPRKITIAPSDQREELARADLGPSALVLLVRRPRYMRWSVQRKIAGRQDDRARADTVSAG